MKNKNNLEPSKDQVDLFLILCVFLLALNGCEGWGWLILILLIRNA